jgi:hypothetical protein
VKDDSAKNVKVASGLGNASTSPLIRPSETRQFLGLYEEALEISDAGLALFSLPDAATFVSRDLDKLSKEAARRAGRNLDVYVHIHLHQLPAGNVTQRGSLETVRAAIGIFSDIDARSPGRKKPPETLCPRVADTILVVEEFDNRYAPLKASLVVASGHGCYPAILLKKPLLVASVDDKALLESLGRRFHKALHQIAAKRGWTGAVDYCDPAKVLRLPGCVNYKDANHPQPVRVVYQNEARFTLSDLGEVLPPLTDRNLFQGADVPVAETAPVAVCLTNDVNIEPLVAGLRANHELFGPTWDNLRLDLDDQSCSGYDMAIADIGVACGLPDRHIAALIQAHRAKFTGPKQQRRGQALLKYIARTITKARVGKQSSEEAECGWAAVEAPLKSSAVGPAANMLPAERSDSCSVSKEEPASEPAQPAGAAIEGPLDPLGCRPAPSHASAAGEPAASASVASTDKPALPTFNAVETEQAGVAPQAQVHAPADFLIAKIRATGDPAVLYQNISLVAGLSDAGVATLYQQLKAVLGSKLNYNHFNRAIKDERARARQKKAVRQQAADPRPVIRTDDRLLDGIAADAIEALETANNPPVVFRRGGALVMIHPDEDGRPVILRANEPMMRGRLARVARFQRETKQDLIWVSPPEDLTRDVLSANLGVFPALGVVTQLPIFRPDGTFRLEPGYDPVTRAYYVPTLGFRLGAIPAEPTRAEAQAAALALDEVIGEFPFETGADKANCIALLLTAFLRIAFRYKVPLAVIDAPKWGTGKTLLAMLVYTIVTGSEGTVCAAPTTEEEWRKRMTSLLERGSAVVIIDNVDQPLRSPALSAVLTAPYWEDRVLGRTEDIRLPNVSTWICTGNNIVLGGEMARRAYRIRLDAKVANPAARTGFKRTDQELLQWAATNRGEIVASLMVMIRAWFAGGQPKAAVSAFGSFDSWARTAGGILQYAGVTEFLCNLETLQKEADEESRQWDQFLRALAITFGERDFAAADIAERVLHERGLLGLSFPEEIGHPDERTEGGDSSLVRRIGRALARKCGTRFGDLDLRIERGEPDKHTKVQRWKVAGNVKGIQSVAQTESAGFQNDS